MYFTRLELTNFGLFNGQHILDLSPETYQQGQNARPIFLIGGKNGAGKTTVLEAIKLCLYGPASLGPVTKRTFYENYLKKRIHRKHGAPLSNSFASVSVAFVYTSDAANIRYEVERTWQRLGQGLQETLVVRRDGQPLPPNDYTWWEKFLNDLLPPGLADLFFFDGEKIQALADDPDNQALKTSIRSLLGLDIVDRLRADLNIYLVRNKNAVNAGLDYDLDRVKSALISLDDAFQPAFTALGQTNRLLEQAEGKIEAVERELSKNNEKYANRPALKKQADQLEETIEGYKRQIQELANTLFPFAIIPDLGRQLRSNLLAEQTIQQNQKNQEALSQVIDNFIDHILKNDQWLDHLHLEDSAKSKLLSGLTNIIYEAKTGAVGETQFAGYIHDLSNQDRQEILGWLDQAITTSPHTIRTAGQNLELANAELTAIQTQLLDLSSNENESSTFELQQLAKLHQEIGALTERKTKQELQVQQLRTQRAELERQEQGLYLRLMRGDDPTQRLQMVGRVQNALVKYEEVLRTEKLTQLEKRIVDCFGRLSRKGNYIRRVSINPKTFETTLFNQKDDPLPKDDLSAGEKQIYAVAILWALCMVSGRNLPVIVDTPLGRLDSEHRQLLVERYFPHASHQVVLLSTDTEIDEELYTQITPAVQRSYHLNYVPSQAATVIQNGYFWEPSILEEIIQNPIPDPQQETLLI